MNIWRFNKNIKSKYGTIEKILKVLPEKLKSPMSIYKAEKSETVGYAIYRLHMQKNENDWAAGYIFLAALEPYDKLIIKHGATLYEALLKLLPYVVSDTGLEKDEN